MWLGLFGSIRRIQITLTLAAILPALVIILYTGIKAREHSLREMHDQVSLLTRGISEYQDRTAQDMRQLLAVLAQTPRVHRAQEPATSEFLKTIMDINPALANIFVADAKGDVLASAKPVDWLVNVADRDYFQEAMATGGFAAGGLHMGEVVDFPVLAFAQAVKGADGRPVGLVGVSMRLDGYRELFTKANFPENSVLSVADRYGYRICRFPQSDTLRVGQPFPEDLWKAISGPETHGVFSLTGADGVRRVYSFAQHRLEPGGEPYLYVLAGIPEEKGLSEANAVLGRNLVLLILAAGLALITTSYLSGLVLGRRIDRLVSVTERVGGGDLSARMGPSPGKSDLDRLERSVDAMAEGLMRNEAARRRAEEELRQSHDRLEQRVGERTSELLLANERLKREVRDRAQAEEALRRSEKNYRILYEQAPVGILLLDRLGRILDANPAALAMLDMDLPELKDLAYRELIDPRDLAERGIDRESLDAGKAVTTERVFMTSRGEKLPADVIGSLVNGEFYQVIFNDISQRKRLEDFREDLERIMRHDLKGPLMGVMSMESLISRSHNLSDKQRLWLEQIRESGQRMLRMINDSLVLYKMEAKTYRAQPKPVDLIRVARVILMDKAQAAGQQDLELDLTLDGAQPGPQDRFMVLAEDIQCFTLLENLIANAVEASPRGGRVEVGFDSAGPGLFIRNKGEVPETIRDRFFDKFATAGKKYGTGLGTYSARLIALSFGWDISVDYDVPGQTTLSLGFPPVDPT
jgi:PAS domain S-box-containing protein